MKTMLAKLWKAFRFPKKFQLFVMRFLQDQFLVGLTGIIFNDKNEVLLFKHVYRAHSWSLPGGYMKAGEHPKEALVREVKEETNLAVKNPKLIAILQSTEDPRAPGHFMFFYKVEAKGILKSNDWVENSDIGWFDINNPPKIGWRSHKLMLKKLQEKSI